MARSVKELVSKMEWDGSNENSMYFILLECTGGRYGKTIEHATRGVLSVRVLDSVKTRKYIWTLMDIYDAKEHREFKNVLQREVYDGVNERSLVPLEL